MQLHQADVDPQPQRDGLHSQREPCDGRHEQPAHVQATANLSAWGRQLPLSAEALDNLEIQSRPQELVAREVEVKRIVELSGFGGVAQFGRRQSR